MCAICHEVVLSLCVSFLEGKKFMSRPSSSASESYVLAILKPSMAEKDQVEREGVEKEAEKEKKEE